MQKLFYSLIGMLCFALELCYSGTITFKLNYTGNPSDPLPKEYIAALSKAKNFLSARIKSTTKAPNYEYVLSHKLVDIDEQYGVLGYGGPTQIIPHTGVAYTGLIALDKADHGWQKRIS